MDEQELRALVRQTVARHLGERSDPLAPSPLVRRSPGEGGAPVSLSDCLSHPSHGRFAIVRGDQHDEGVCLIEPAVVCNHCGYCQSWGH
jgi:hypothetical protein